MKVQQMPQTRIQAAVSVSHDPISIIRFVADVRNRIRYQDSLTSVTKIDGAPGEVTQSWNWTWDSFGNKFEGLGETVEYDEGRLYCFVTEGEIVSRFTYRAERVEAGSRLFIDVEFDLPKVFADHHDLKGLLTVAQVRAQDAAFRLQTLIGDSKE
jgi:hypothetical protein